MKTHLQQFADGILFQFLMVGSLSFSHIHDVVAVHGQPGWKAWLYPLSIDLLTVAAFRKIRKHDGGGWTWVAFLLGLSASLAANVIESWTATPSGRLIAVAIGVWPAVALLVCTLLAHDDATETVATKPVASREPASRPAVATVATPAPAARPVATAVPATSTTSRVATAVLPQTATATPSATRPKQRPAATTGAKGDTTINTKVLQLIAAHGEKLTGPMVAQHLGVHRSNGSLHLKRVKEQLAGGKLDAHPEAARARAALSSSLSSPTQATTVSAP